jgi:hypothetical protein
MSGYFSPNKTRLSTVRSGQGTAFLARWQFRNSRRTQSKDNPELEL